MQKSVYEHIKENNWKTAGLVLLFPIIFIALVFLFIWAGLYFSLKADLPSAEILSQTITYTMQVAIPTIIICVAWMVISWAFGDSMMLSSANAIEITPDQKKYKQVFNSVENIAIAAGLPVPKVYIIDDDSLNAFATGRSPNDASIALTIGIINKLDKLELEGVIAHEMAHIGNRDIRLDMFLITGIGVTVFLADIMFRIMHSSSIDSDKKNALPIVAFMAWLAFSVFNFIISPLLRMAISRKREFSADATGAFITRNPMALASALKKISEDSRVEVLDTRKSMAVACIADPGNSFSEFIGSLYSTHPKIEERIKRLESM